MADSCDGGCTRSAEESTATPGHKTLEAAGFASVFTIPKMDCPSEESMIRMAVDAVDPTVTLEFDTPNRKATVFHGDDIAAVQVAIENLGLGATLDDRLPIEREKFSTPETAAQAANWTSYPVSTLIQQLRLPTTMALCVLYSS